MTKKNILSTVRREGYLTANLYAFDIIEIEWDESIETIEVIHLKEMKNTVFELGGGKKMALVFAPRDFLQLSKEAGKYAVTDDGIEYTLANAVLINGLASRIIYNFFIKINHPKVPTKGFSNREEAFTWLSKIHQELQKVS